MTKPTSIVHLDPNEELVNAVVKGTFAILRARDPSGELDVRFLAKFTCAMAHLSLTENVEKASALDKTWERFRQVKVNIQCAISSGFQAAMSDFTGQTVEYYCIVSTVPEPLSKRSN